MDESKRKRTLEKKYKFVTFVLGRMKLSIEHRKKKSRGLRRRSKTKNPEIWELSTLVVKDIPCKCTVTVMWRANGSLANFLWGRNNRGEIGQVQRTLHSWWKKKVAEPISCRQIHLTRDFFSTLLTLCTQSHGGSRCRSVRIHSIHMPFMMFHV